MVRMVFVRGLLHYELFKLSPELPERIGTVRIWVCIYCTRAVFKFKFNFNSFLFFVFYFFEMFFVLFFLFLNES